MGAYKPKKPSEKVSSFKWENTDRHKYESFRFRFKISKRCAYNTA